MWPMILLLVLNVLSFVNKTHSCSYTVLTYTSYKDRFALLAESMEREKHDITVREKAQTKVML